MAQRRIHILSSLSLLLASFCLAACCSSTGAEDLQPYFLNYGSQSGTFSDLLTSEEKNGLVGLMHIEYMKYNTLEGDLSNDPYIYTGAASYSELRTADDLGLPRDIARAEVNGTAFIRSDIGWLSAESFLLHLDSVSPNVVSLQLDVDERTILDSFFLHPAPRITNLTVGESISRSDSIHLTWSGANQDQASISIVVRQQEEDDVGVGTAVGWRTANTGAAAIKLFPAQLKKGIADIYLSQFEKRFIALPDGKKICILTEYRFVQSVRIVD